MRVHIQRLCGVTIPEDLPHRRAHRIPEAERDTAFHAAFDDRTLIYDCTYLKRAGGYLLTAPSLGVLWPLLRDGLRIAGLPARPHRRRFGRCDLVFVKGIRGPVEVRIEGRALPVLVRASLADSFAGLNAAVTMNRDNDLRHIRDWLGYHVRAQGLQGAVIFDNGSTAYGPQDLAAAMVDGTGLKAAAVIEAPFNYGGLVRTRSGTQRLGFLQPAVLNLARAEVLSRARAVLGADIDELVVGPAGQSVFDAAVRRPSGYVKLAGEWVWPKPGAPAPQPHAAHYWRAAPPRRCKTKWVARPDALLSRLVGWKVHDLGLNISDPVRPDREFSFIHCVAATTGWKPQSPRWKIPDGLRRDANLAGRLGRHLGERGRNPSQGGAFGGRSAEKGNFMIRRYGSAKWQGGLRDGKGQVSTETGVLSDQPYGFKTRFEDEKGTNPEELIGAAHAACFAMALSLNLGQAGLTAENIETKSTVSLEESEGGFTITKVHVDVSARVPGASEDQFRQAAEATKTGCPVSKALNAEITMEARLA